MGRTLEQHLMDSGLNSLRFKTGTMMEIGDNDILYGYEKSLSSIRPITDVSVNDICVSGNFIGVVTEVYLDSGILRGVKVKYEDLDGKIRGDHDSVYVEKVFVFGNYNDGIRVDTTKANVVDSSDIKIIKRDNGTYKNEISKIMDLHNTKRENL